MAQAVPAIPLMQLRPALRPHQGDLQYMMAPPQSGITDQSISMDFLWAVCQVGILGKCFLMLPARAAQSTCQILSQSTIKLFQVCKYAHGCVINGTMHAAGDGQAAHPPPRPRCRPQRCQHPHLPEHPRLRAGFLDPTPHRLHAAGIATPHLPQSRFLSSKSSTLRIAHVSSLSSQMLPRWCSCRSCQRGGCRAELCHCSQLLDYRFQPSLQARSISGTSNDCANVLRCILIGI